jgi:glycosyltransferase involved in cell wall biosynthesis
MRIAVLSDCRKPTLPVGGHGLGRVACDLATGLHARGHTVTLYAGPDSIAPEGVMLRTHDDEVVRVGTLDTDTADVWLDLSHLHALSVHRPAVKQVHYIMDDECTIEPVCCVVGSAFRQRQFPVSEIVPLGIDTAAIPFDKTGGRDLLYVAKMERRKGWDIAIEVANKAGKPLAMYGELFLYGAPTPEQWRGTIDDNAALYRILGSAQAFLAPYRDDAGGRVLLEAQAAGTPVLTFGDVGCISHVEHCVSGYVCHNDAEMVDALADVRYLKRERVREWAVAHHDLKVMIDGIERLLTRAADGERW